VEFIPRRYFLHFRSGIGDRKEAAAVAAAAFVEILLIYVGLQRRAGLAGDNEQRALHIDLGFNRPDLRGIGGVEHVQPRESLNLAERQRQHLRTQAGAAHAEQENVAKPALANVGGDLAKLLNIGQLLVDNVQPAHPLALVFSGPQ
jgi:hypothetical protein